MLFVLDISKLQCGNDLWFLLFYHLTPLKGFKVVCATDVVFVFPKPALKPQYNCQTLHWVFNNDKVLSKSFLNQIHRIVKV